MAGQRLATGDALVRVRLADGAVLRRDNAGCGFRYRDSDLPATEVVVAAERKIDRLQEARPFSRIERKGNGYAKIKSC